MLNNNYFFSLQKPLVSCFFLGLEEMLTRSRHTEGNDLRITSHQNNSENKSFVSRIDSDIKTEQTKGLEEKGDKSELWKENVLNLFEFSNLYPFIHIRSKYGCFICTKLFLDTTALREHYSEHTVNEIGLALNRIKEKIVKVDVSNMQCKICGSTLDNLRLLKLHLQGHGKRIDPNIQDVIPFKLDGVDFECQTCGEKFFKLRLLIIHMNRHYNNYSCETCGSGFISLNLLKRHLEVHQVGSYPCSVCEKVFTSAAKRSIHLRGVHLKQYPRTCPMCPERFISNYKKIVHLRFVHHQSVVLHRCDTCGREYNLKSQLERHVRSVHMQERKFECEVCRKRFFTQYRLTRHGLTHTGERHFKCPVCGKLYARKDNMETHAKSCKK
ncbi:zinc finger protein 836-like [Zerene cesonia]|uniref:zinc finger protein 836-like n=1 Tax=Zerene cesonia TaxID=33412 RepID=UPI0018E5696A|nr:zinc finger protein 836-like [Zerene cesonia]